LNIQKSTKNAKLRVGEIARTDFGQEAVGKNRRGALKFGHNRIKSRGAVLVAPRLYFSVFGIVTVENLLLFWF
jgi:hypothetical protein